MVSETIINFLKQDPTSYLNNMDDSAVHADGVDVDPSPGGKIQILANILQFAGVS